MMGKQAAVRRHRAAPVLFAILSAAGAAGSEPVSVVVATRDGNAVVGAIDLGSFKLESSLGTIDVRLADATQITFTEEGAIVNLRDGSTVQGKTAVEEWTVRSNLGELKIKTSSISGIRMTAPPPGYGDRERPGLPGAAGDLAPPPPGPPVTPFRRLALNAAVSQLVLSPDGATLYALNVTGAKLLVIAAGSLELRREIPLPAGAEAFSLAPGGRTAVSVGGTSVAVVDLEAGKVTKRFDVEHKLRHVHAVDGQTVWATGSLPGSSDRGLVRIEVAKQAAVKWLPDTGLGPIQPAVGGRKFYTLTGMLLFPPAGASGPAEPAWWALQSMSVGPGNYRLTPDARLAISTSGRVYRTGRSYVADMLECGAVEPHVTSLGLERYRRLLVFTANGFVLDYDPETLARGKEVRLGMRVHAAVAEETEGALTVFAASLQSRYHEQYPNYAANLPAGDLYTFGLADLVAVDALKDPPRAAAASAPAVPAAAPAAAPAGPAPKSGGTAESPAAPSPAPAADPAAEKDCARWLNLARNFLNQSNHDKAEENAKRVLERCPDGKAAEEARGILEKVRAARKR